MTPANASSPTKLPRSAAHVEIGKRVRSRRVALGLSQPQLGMLIGTSGSNVSAYESGTNDMPLSALLAVADALGCSVAELVGEVSPAQGEVAGAAAMIATLTDMERHALLILVTSLAQRNPQA